jgi:hypothetical protein
MCHNVFQYPHGFKLLKKKESIDATNQNKKLHNIVGSQNPEEKKTDYLLHKNTLGR